MGLSIFNDFMSIRVVTVSLKKALDLFFPRNCIHCGDAADTSSYDFICKLCAKDLIECVEPACCTCGYPFYGEIMLAKKCPHCAELDPAFDRGKTLFIAKGIGRSLLHELKYRRGMYILNDLARIARRSRHYLEYIRNAILVPVPLHPVRLRERGFNQSEHIAKMLVNCTGSTARVDKLLIRNQYTQSQTNLNRAARSQNVKNAFALASNTVLNPDEQYIIVDDVFTTGSTLNACAKVLRRGGANRIKVATMGHG